MIFRLFNIIGFVKQNHKSTEIKLKKLVKRENEFILFLKKIIFFCLILNQSNSKKALNFLNKKNKQRMI